MSVVFHRNSRAMRKSPDIAAIFVHAGAGYHSVQNEHVHLKACEDAATAGMAVLRSGGRAVDAVEIAIKVLEDREITNAGYGSNLALDGHVEGDAVVVDHHGRSGGVGAIAQVKNPICVARKIYEASLQPLSLRRVPPNLLVGQGATDWAYQHNVPILPHDALISPGARDRWLRWRADLKNEDRRNEKRLRKQLRLESRHAPPQDPPPEYNESVGHHIQHDESKVTRECVWNEGQPTSPDPIITNQSLPTGLQTPSPTSSVRSIASSMPNFESNDLADARDYPPQNGHPGIRHVQQPDAPRTLSQEFREIADTHDAAGDDMLLEREPGDPQSSGENSAAKDACTGFQEHWATKIWGNESTTIADTISDAESSDSTIPWPSSSSSEAGPTMHRDDASAELSNMQITSPVAETFSQSMPAEDASTSCPAEEPANLRRPPEVEEGREDLVTDTVGAIAIDNDGNVACGASSGGIGMKYRGRMGPAALVGVGAAVVPPDPDDRNRTTSSVVTSGTGEHMGTTMAAQVCADRLYSSIKKRRGGGFEACEDDLAIKSFIEADFMGHPSVKQSQSMGAIGVLGVKKTAYGTYLYFAHNTDSFALASMHADEPRPTCTMSRSHGNGMVAQGGRALRFRKKW